MKKKMEYHSGIVEAISTAFICQLFFLKFKDVDFCANIFIFTII